MNRAERRSADRQLQAENARWPEHCVQVPRDRWINTPPGLIEAWRSKSFLVQVYEPLPNGVQRLSICRTAIGINGHWKDGIAWEEIQQLKREIGRGDAWATEIYPPDEDVVNVSNMRHIWLLPAAPDYGWFRRPQTQHVEETKA